LAGGGIYLAHFDIKFDIIDGDSKETQG